MWSLPFTAILSTKSLRQATGALAGFGPMGLTLKLLSTMAARAWRRRWYGGAAVVRQFLLSRQHTRQSAALVKAMLIIQLCRYTVSTRCRRWVPRQIIRKGSGVSTLPRRSARTRRGRPSSSRTKPPHSIPATARIPRQRVGDTDAESHPGLDRSGRRGPERPRPRRQDAGWSRFSTAMALRALPLRPQQQCRASCVALNIAAGTATITVQRLRNVTPAILRAGGARLLRQVKP